MPLFTNRARSNYRPTTSLTALVRFFLPKAPTKFANGELDVNHASIGSSQPSRLPPVNCATSCRFHTASYRTHSASHCRRWYCLESSHALRTFRGNIKGCLRPESFRLRHPVVRSSSRAQSSDLGFQRLRKEDALELTIPAMPAIRCGGQHHERRRREEHTLGEERISSSGEG